MGKASAGTKKKAKNKGGRPLSYTPKEIEDMVEDFISYCEANRHIIPTKFKFYFKYNLHRNKLTEYLKRDEFQCSIKKLFGYIEDRIVENMIDKKLFSPGQVFYLKNAFGWSDKQEIKTEIKIEVPQKKDLF